MSLNRTKAEVTVLTSAADFITKAKELSQTKVVVIDVHDEWCGANLAIVQFYSQMWLEFPDPDSRIGLFSVSKEIPEIYDAFKTCCPHVKVAQQGCRPLFLVFRLGQLMESVDGVNAPHLRSVVSTNLPKLPPKE